MSFKTDFRSFERDMKSIAKTAVPKAASWVLNDAAFGAQAGLKREVKKAFDKPAPFTEKGFRVTKARPSDAADMYSEIYIAERQARYLGFQIDGGVRKPGDVGAGSKMMVAYSDRLSPKTGGIPRGRSKQLAGQLEREKAKRTQRRASGLHGNSERGRKGMIKQGIFFGRPMGRPDAPLGYYRRWKHRMWSSTDRRTYPIKGSRLTLLLSFERRTHYVPRFDYADVVRTAAVFRISPREFRRALDSAMKK